VILSFALWVACGVAYGAFLVRLIAVAEQTGRRREKTVAELTAMPLAGVRSELGERYQRRQDLIFRRSDDARVEQSRRDVLATLALSAIVLVASVPIAVFAGPLVDTLLAQSSPWIVALVVASGISFFWALELARAMVARPRRSRRITIAAGATVLSIVTAIAIGILAG
jgi:hypothetical protein